MNYVILVKQNGMGTAETELSHKLIKNYFTLIAEENTKPHAILFYAEGVKLLANDSPVSMEMKQLEKQQIKLIACKTCLDYYGIGFELNAGIAGSMQDILNYQIQAEKVIAI